MQTYVIKRLIHMIPLLLGISVLSFFIIQLAPGGPIGILEEDYGGDIDPQRIDRLRERYGLDQPIHVQYVRWLSRIVRGDFGISFSQHQPVLNIIIQRMPATLYLNMAALFISYGVAIPIGIAASIRQYTAFDMVTTTLAFMGRALPNFWFGLLLIFFFAIPYEGIPTSGIATRGVEIDTVGFLGVLVDRLKYLMFPAIVLATNRMASLTRYMRSSMLEVVREDYIRTARSKGLHERIVIYRHALRNALLPIITLLGFALATTFSGSVVVENVFSWPGLGTLARRSIFARDYSVVMAFNTIGATLTVIGIFLSDLAYAWVDPRIKFD